MSANASSACRLFEHETEQVVEVGDAAVALLRYVAGEHIGDDGRVDRGLPAGPADERLVCGRTERPGGGPVHLRHERVEVDTPGAVTPDDLADDAPPVGDDRSWPLVEVGPPLEQHATGDGVERAGGRPPAQPQPSEALAELSGGLAGERERHGVPLIGRAGGNAVGEPPGEHPRLS